MHLRPSLQRLSLPLDEVFYHGTGDGCGGADALVIRWLGTQTGSGGARATGRDLAFMLAWSIAVRHWVAAARPGPALIPACYFNAHGDQRFF